MRHHRRAFSAVPGFLPLGVLALAAVSLAGCDTIRDAAGVTHRAPDEFAVVTKAPLIIPPDFNLVPPKPGAKAVNQPDPTADAQVTLFGDNPATVAQNMPGNFSDGEKLLLAYAGAANVDHGIRKRIDSDAAARLEEPGFFGSMFGADVDEGTPVDANAEKDRIDDSKAKGVPPGTNQPAKSDESVQKDSGGWLDGIF